MNDHSSSLFDRSFGVTIAFLTPGLVALFSVATVSDTVRTWFQGAQNGPTFAGLFFVVLGALALGFVVTSVRFFIYEFIRWPWCGCLVGPAPQLNESKRKEHAAEYQDLRLQHYYHYLASTNLSIAIPVGVAIWKAGTPSADLTSTLFGTVIVIAGFATIALGAAGCSAVRRYNDKRVRLLGVLAPTT